jgi:hypothetical protein
MPQCLWSYPLRVIESVGVGLEKRGQVTNKIACHPFRTQWKTPTTIVGTIVRKWSRSR